MKPSAVIDSSSLIFASKSGALQRLLEKRFSKLLIPQAVHRETVEAGEALGKEEVPAIRALLASGFLQVRKTTPVVKDARLGAGEAEALSLAFREKTVLISDDRQARGSGRAMGLKVIPLSSFILWARERNVLPRERAENALNELVKKGYYLKADVYLRLLEEIRGRRTRTY